MWRRERKSLVSSVVLRDFLSCIPLECPSFWAAQVGDNVVFVVHCLAAWVLACFIEQKEPCTALGLAAQAKCVRAWVGITCNNLSHTLVMGYIGESFSHTCAFKSVKVGHLLWAVIKEGKSVYALVPSIGAERSGCCH